MDKQNYSVSDLTLIISNKSFTAFLINKMKTRTDIVFVIHSSYLKHGFIRNKGYLNCSCIMNQSITA